MLGFLKHRYFCQVQTEITDKITALIGKMSLVKKLAPFLHPNLRGGSVAKALHCRAPGHECDPGYGGYFKNRRPCRDVHIVIPRCSELIRSPPLRRASAREVLLWRVKLRNFELFFVHPPIALLQNENVNLWAVSSCRLSAFVLLCVVQAQLFASLFCVFCFVPIVDAHDVGVQSRSVMTAEPRVSTYGHWKKKRGKKNLQLQPLYLFLLVFLFVLFSLFLCFFFVVQCPLWICPRHRKCLFI